MVKQTYCSVLKLIVIIIGFYFLTGFKTLNAQVLKDPAALNLVKVTVDQIYSMQFGEAGATCNLISRKYPDHPVVFLLRGMIVYWKNYPLLSVSAEGREFENLMRTCIEKCDNFNPEDEAEFLLATLCARGSLLAFYSGNGLQSRVISLARTSYRYLRRAFRFTGSYPDFYFFTGLYNYYREAYVDAHPVYKPLFFVFPGGDREKGMIELKIAFNKSIFLRAEASTFLSTNYKYFENDFWNASYFSRTIYFKYPLNPVYQINCIEDLLLIRKYDEAEKVMQSAESTSYNQYYRAQYDILTGILDEKKYKQVESAEKKYLEGINSIKKYGDYGEQYAAYAWFGLSRISAFNNNRHNQKIYQKRALDLTGYDHVNFD